MAASALAVFGRLVFLRDGFEFVELLGEVFVFVFLLAGERGRDRRDGAEIAAVVPGKSTAALDPGPAFGADFSGFGAKFFADEPVHEVGIDQIALILFGKEIALN